MHFEAQIAELERRRERARAMGGPEKLTRRREAGMLDARQRIAHLVDEGTFAESGMLATSVRPQDREKTPADGKVAGFGRIDGREVGIVSNDFTVMGASSSGTNARKIKHVKEVAERRGLPVIYLGESTGARMPDAMGARGIASGDAPTQYRRTRVTPWASAILGPCYGSSAWYACLADFTVMRRGAVMAVSSPRLASLAIAEEVDPEELGGWRLHATATGLVDQVTQTDEEALEAVARFLSYLPSHHAEPPPRRPVPPGSDNACDRMLDILPPEKNHVYDMRKIVDAVVDRDSTFELKASFARSVATALARIDGRTVGVVANNPRFKGGAIDPGACEKVTSFLVLCDSFNVPLIFLVDQPGFLIGIDGERRKAPGKVMNWMNALALCTVPKLSVVVRKSYGQAVLNMGGAGNADEVAAWVTAEVGFMDPVFATKLVQGAAGSDDGSLLGEMAADRSAFDMGAAYSAQAVIDPRETRTYLKRALEIHELRLTGGVGERLMRAWPTTY